MRALGLRNQEVHLWGWHQSNPSAIPCGSSEKTAWMLSTGGIARAWARQGSLQQYPTVQGHAALSQCPNRELAKVALLHLQMHEERACDNQHLDPEKRCQRVGTGSGQHIAGYRLKHAPTPLQLDVGDVLGKLTDTSKNKRSIQVPTLKRTCHGTEMLKKQRRCKANKNTCNIFENSRWGCWGWVSCQNWTDTGFWVNDCDLTRPRPKWFMWGISSSICGGCI